MAASMRAPDPALLDLAPASGAGAAPSAAPLARAPSAKAGDGAAAAADAAPGAAADAQEDEAGVIRLGPLAIGTAGLQRQFRLRQRFTLSDKIKASVGAFYSFTDDRVGPTASITYLVGAWCGWVRVGVGGALGGTVLM